MTIIRDQFIRGFSALKASDARRERLNAAFGNDQDFNCDVGGDPAYFELLAQLEERCRAKEDEDGPWPENEGGESDIAFALIEGLGPVYDEAGGGIDMPATAEGLWAMWEQSGTGPFRAGRP